MKLYFTYSLIIINLLIVNIHATNFLNKTPVEYCQDQYKNALYCAYEQIWEISKYDHLDTDKLIYFSGRAEAYSECLKALGVLLEDEDWIYGMSDTNRFDITAAKIERVLYPWLFN